MSLGVIFVEESSAEIVTRCLVERLGLTDRLILIPHEGKSDLIGSFPRKIAHWRAPVAQRFVVARDNDGANCVDLKRSLLERIPAAANERVRVRLVMQALESWYLGDGGALYQAGFISPSGHQKWSGKQKFRDPDKLTNAVQEFEKLAGFPGKLAAARAIGPYLDPDRNRPASFRLFAATLQWAAALR